MYTKKDLATATEEDYRAMIRQIKACSYRPARYGELLSDRQVIIRHDVDISMHRALSLAKIEASEGVFATYFVDTRSTFYSFSERTIESIILEIQRMGHDIGLYFQLPRFDDAHWGKDEFEAVLKRERRLLEQIAGSNIPAVAWCDMKSSKLQDFRMPMLSGMMNACSHFFCAKFALASDNDGPGRDYSMCEVIAAGHNRLQVLTHPERWTPDHMVPADQISRAINGRRASMIRAYPQLDVGGQDALNISIFGQ